VGTEVACVSDESGGSRRAFVRTTRLRWGDRL